MQKTDTIAAIATPAGVGGIGTIRISGPDAIFAADRIFFAADKKKLADCATHTVHYGFIKHPETLEKTDEVLVTLMRAPRTFTAEDVVEISTHGSPTVLAKVMDLLFGCGVRPAQAGEFTKRAFLNGRIDLSRAEAVLDVIHADSDASLKSAIAQLDGGLARRIDAIRQPLLYCCAQFAAAVDYPDDEIAELTDAALAEILEKAVADCDALLATAQDGCSAKNGIVCVIAGKPNTGKSSLLNALTNSERAIVTDIQGTTRDVIEQTITVDGIALRLFDTAGIRETADTVEQIGVKKTLDYIHAADLVLLMLDSSAEISDEDRDCAKAATGKPCIIVLNKSDLETKTSEDAAKTLAEGAPIVQISTHTGEGLDALRAAICDVCRTKEIRAADNVLSNLRHIHALRDARASLAAAVQTLSAGMPADMCVIDVNDALEHLGLITGLTVSADIVNEIFANFCVGK